MSTVRFLRTFVAVADHGSFAAAAGQVALTQAAVSLQMRALETELRRELFDRNGRVAVLNADGRALLPQARRMLALYDEMRLPLASDEAMAGAVAVGAVVSVMGGLSHAVAHMKRTLGYPFNRSYSILRAWSFQPQTLTTLVPSVNSRHGFSPMLTAWITWNGCAGRPDSSVRLAAKLADGDSETGDTCARTVTTGHP